MDAKDDEAILLNGSTSFFKATFNGLNALSGIAILSVPYALSRGGWASLILLLILATAMCYTGLLLQRFMESDHNLATYPDIGCKAFGPKGRFIVSLFTNLELYLVAAGFLIQVADNLQNLLPNVEVTIEGFTVIGKQTFILLSALVVMPTVWIDNMALLSYVSASGVMASIVLTCMVVWAGAFDGVGYHQRGEVLNWSGLATSLSLYAFSYGAHSVFPTVYISMRNPKQFKWVLILCFVITTILNSCTAISGYLMFGSEVRPQITLNLPMNKLSSKVVTYISLANPLSKYALFLKPIVNVIESHRFVSEHGRVCRLCMRSMVVCSTVVLALTLPYYDIFMSFVGAFTVAVISILLPCLCYLKIYWACMDVSFHLVIVGVIVLMGFLVLVVGTYSCLIQTFEKI